MKEYKFNVRFLGNTTLTVPATSPEEAKEKVKSLIEAISLKKLAEKENSINDVEIVSSNIQKNIRQSGSRYYER